MSGIEDWTLADWAELQADLDELEASDPSVAEAKRRLDEVSERLANGGSS
jgi:hypothetical protein